MSEFSKRFKYLREARGITQEKAAEILGISRSTVAGYESEDKSRVPREETLKKIADHFDVSIDYLLGRTDDKKANLSNQSRKLIDMLDLSDEEIMSKMEFIVDGMKLDQDDIKVFLAIVRSERLRKKQGLVSEQNRL